LLPSLISLVLTGLAKKTDQKFGMIPEPSEFSWENPGMARRSVMHQLYQDVSQYKSNA